jgi:hypothetical protein
MNKIKRSLSILIVVTIIIVPLDFTCIHASESAPTKKTELTFIVIGSYSIWLHADGVTWQDTGHGVKKPDDDVFYEETIKYPGDAKDKL